jgi:hypothetical protein
MNEETLFDKCNLIEFSLIDLCEVTSAIAYFRLECNGQVWMVSYLMKLESVSKSEFRFIWI